MPRVPIHSPTTQAGVADDISASPARLTAVSTSPASRHHWGGWRSISRPAMGEDSDAIKAVARNTSPVVSGLAPSTWCIHSGTSSTQPNRMMDCRQARMTLRRKARCPNSDSDSKGAGASWAAVGSAFRSCIRPALNSIPRSTTTNPARAASPSPRGTSAEGVSSSARLSIRLSENSTAPMPRVISKKPGRSKRLARLGASRWRQRQPTTSPSSAKGRFMTNSARQWLTSSSRPPTLGPMAGAIITANPQMPLTRPRCSGG